MSSAFRLYVIDNQPGSTRKDVDSSSVHPIGAPTALVLGAPYICISKVFLSAPRLPPLLILTFCSSYDLQVSAKQKVSYQEEISNMHPTY